MKALIQRVTAGAVVVDGEEIGRIADGLVILLGVMPEDDEETADFLADRCAGLRIFEDAEGKMNRSLLDISGGALVISQFTLCADVSSGRRPSFSCAAKPDVAVPLYERFMKALAEKNISVSSGRFAADMKVEIHNDGPVTMMLETKRSATGKLQLC